MAEGGFDYAAYQKNLMGGNPDNALLVTFEYRAEKVDDGGFRNVEYTKIWIDKDNEVIRPTTDEDRTRFSARYKAFLEGEEKPEEGTPISMCPFATQAEVSACKAQRIFTLEQLSQTADERLQRAHLLQFKYRAIDYLKGMKDVGYIGELRGEIEALKRECAMLKERLADKPSEPSITGEVTCPHCGVSGKGGVMKRWHFDNCKNR